MVERFDPLRVEKGQKKFGYINVVDMLATKIDMPVGVINGASSGLTFTVTGGLYPTEYCGVEAAARLYQCMDPKDLVGKLIIVPVVNLPCLRFRTPWFNLTRSISPMDGLDINRAFPGDPKGTVTSVVAYRLFHDIILKSDYHVDLRGGDLNESHLVHTIFLRIGEEIDKKCEEMAKVFGLEYVRPETPETGHSKSTLIYEAVTRGIPSIISESGLGYREQPLDEFINLHVQGTMNLLKHFGMIEGGIVKPKNQRSLDMGMQKVIAPVSGIFQAIADQGDVCKAGELLGLITDIDGSELAKINSPVDGVIHCMFPRRLVYPGDRVYNILRMAARADGSS